MEVTIDQAELFPNVELYAKKRPVLRQFMDAVEREGPLLPRSMVPYVLDVSRQRVQQLIDEDRIATVMVGEKEFVPVAALNTFMADQRKVGRPVKELTLRESFRRYLPSRK
jgi:hypothetical protein